MTFGYKLLSGGVVQVIDNDNKCSYLIKLDREFIDEYNRGKL